MGKKNKDKYYEILVQNAEKGERYLLKLEDYPTWMLTIPLIRPDFRDKGENIFTFKVLEPKELEGIYKRSVDEIEELERKDF